MVLCDEVDGPLNIVDPLAATEPRTDEGESDPLRSLQMSNIPLQR